jgi:hypothetical protein
LVNPRTRFVGPHGPRNILRIIHMIFVR